MRVLVYVDSPAMVQSSVAIGRALESELAAEIAVLVVNSARHQADFPPEFTVYDLGQLEDSQGLKDGRRRMTGAQIVRLGLLILFSPLVLVAARRGQSKTQTLDEIQHAAARGRSSLRGLFSRFQLIRDARSIYSTWSSVRRLGTFLGRVKPDLLVVFEDNIETLTRVLVETGRRMNIPSVVVPYTIPNPLEPAMNLLGSPQHAAGKWVERGASFFKSRWVFHFQGRGVLRLSKIRAIAMESMDLSVPEPWILNSGSAAAIALDSEAARESYLDLGFPGSQLEVVGDPAGDQLHQGLSNRARLRVRTSEENGFENTGRPIVVCAFPPDQYRGTKTGAYEVPSFEALVAAWMEVLLEVSEQANVLVRPHPRLDPGLLKAYESRHLRITWQPTAELVPVADLYIASISATIRWAIACGVPVINYDCYRYRYDDYEKASGVITVFSRDDFRETARRFFSDGSFAEDLRERQRAVMGKWGLVDGGFARRFAGLISRIALMREANRSSRAAQGLPL